MQCGDYTKDREYNIYYLPGDKMYSLTMADHFSTVNVDIFAQLNFRASSPMEHIRVFQFSRTYQLILFDL